MYHGDSHLHVVARAQQAHAPPELRSRDLGALMAFGRRVLAEDGEEVRVGYHLLKPCMKVKSCIGGPRGRDGVRIDQS